MKLYNSKYDRRTNIQTENLQKSRCDTLLKISFSGIFLPKKGHLKMYGFGFSGFFNTQMGCKNIAVQKL